MHVNVAAFVFGRRGGAAVVHHGNRRAGCTARYFLWPVLLPHLQRTLGINALRLGRRSRGWASDSGNTHESLQIVNFKCNHLTYRSP